MKVKSKIFKMKIKLKNHLISSKKKKSSNTLIKSKFSNECDKSNEKEVNGWGYYQINEHFIYNYSVRDRKSRSKARWT